MGVVYHANYLTWLEIARTEWTKANGYAYHDIESRGFYLPVVDVSVQYKHPARYGDEVAVHCRLKEVSPVRLQFEYDARLARDPSVEIVKGTTQHVWVDRSWKPVRLSKAAPDVYEALLHGAKGGR